jgi:predicted ribosome quality control (RQC) complex YloA/Tae2 family protein
VWKSRSAAMPPRPPRAILSQYSLSNALFAGTFVAELSGLEVLVLVKELDLRLRGFYVNNIYSLGDSLAIRLRRPGDEDALLVVSQKRGAWISSLLSERTETTPFASKVRQELERKAFVSARQQDLDRAMEFSFGDGAGSRVLVVEMVPPGNVMVTDTEGKILVVKRETRTKDRVMAKGGTYSPPVRKRTSPEELTPGAVREALESEATAGAAIGRHVGLPRKYVQEVLQKLGIEDAEPSERLMGREAEAVRAVKELVQAARERPRPCVCEFSGGQEVFAVPPDHPKVLFEAESISEVCDRLFLDEAKAPPEASKGPGAPGAEAEKLRSQEEGLRRKALEVRSAAEKAQLADLEGAILAVEAAGVKLRKTAGSPASVASEAFAYAKELEGKADAVHKAAARVSRRAKKKAGPESKPLAMKKKEWFQKFRWFMTSGGKLAVGGRDAQSNSTLLKRHMQDVDTVYHADLFGSPFFLLKQGSTQTEPESLEVAQATVAFSSAWKTGLGAADAYWVSPSQVSAAAPSGEYLPRGSFAINGSKNFVKRSLVELAVGVDEKGRVVSGPETAVSAAGPYVVLRPHKEKGSDTAKSVFHELRKLAGEGASFDLDDVARALPAGGGKVVRRVERRSRPLS